MYRAAGSVLDLCGGIAGRSMRPVPGHRSGRLDSPGPGAILERSWASFSSGGRSVSRASRLGLAVPIRVQRGRHEAQRPVDPDLSTLDRVAQ